jgi:hypothetical protein
MEDQPLRARAAALIAAAATHTPAERDRLVVALRQRCWPGDGADRTEPIARACVRRWGPQRLGAIALRCTCPHGRCDLCN